MGKFSKGITTSLFRMFSDFVVCSIGFCIVAIIFNVDLLDWGNVSVGGLFGIIYLLASKGFGLYNMTIFYYFDRIIIMVTKSCLITAAVLATSLLGLGDSKINFSFFWLFTSLTYFLLMCNAFVTRYIMKAMNLVSAPRTALVGYRSDYDKFHRFMGQSNVPIKEVGYISLSREHSDEYLGSIYDLDKIIHDNAIDQVYILQRYTAINLKKYVKVCTEIGVSVKVLCHSSKIEGVHTYVSSCGTYPVLTYHSVSLNKYSIIVKRILDIIGSTVGIILSSPIMIAAAIMIKLDSPGPILFKQVRVGMNGRKFLMYKFRSMYIDAEERKKELMALNEVDSDKMFKIKNDPRITKAGNFLRKTSIDELPQFFNVLLGTMSLVGTRPPTEDEVENYERKHWRRMSIKPGITGMWQVNGRNKITDFEQIVEFDLDYISRWSIWLDIQILLKTVIVLVTRHGAY